MFFGGSSLYLHSLWFQVLWFKDSSHVGHHFRQFPRFRIVSVSCSFSAYQEHRRGLSKFASDTAVIEGLPSSASRFLFLGFDSLLGGVDTFNTKRPEYSRTSFCFYRRYSSLCTRHSRISCPCMLADSQAATPDSFEGMSEVALLCLPIPLHSSPVKALAWCQDCRS